MEAEGKRNIVQRERQRVIQEEYEPLKDTIDALRARHGLPRLPNLQEEEDMETARYAAVGVREGRVARELVGFSVTHTTATDVR